MEDVVRVVPSVCLYGLCPWCGQPTQNRNRTPTSPHKSGYGRQRTKNLSIFSVFSFMFFPSPTIKLITKQNHIADRAHQVRERERVRKERANSITFVNITSQHIKSIKHQQNKHQ
uniref:Uncharacterized protein n=1 Tax=Craspedostauros australis TaxID=1486917 RepID=A0A7R9WQ00_9STRA|mmetsp:Transcript_15424/g.42658  ORF Transcript_15424/g.42658 Transcript_15424/m.42658 type:complete len:115 (+) Transcript_15424:46-390(+)